MADNVRVKDSASGLDVPVAADDIGGVEYQRIKIGWGPDGTFNEVTDTDGIRVPIGGGQIGLLSETAPASDTAASGLNGRLQRIAQRLTSLIALLPASLGAKASAASLSVVLASDQGAVPSSAVRREAVLTCSVASGQTVSAAIDTAGYGNIGVIVPATFDGTSISFQTADILAGTYVPVYDITGQPVAVPVAASRAVDLPGELLFCRFIKIVCGTVQATTTTDFLVLLRS